MWILINFDGLITSHCIHRRKPCNYMCNTQLIWCIWVYVIRTRKECCILCHIQSILYGTMKSLCSCELEQSVDYFQTKWIKNGLRPNYIFGQWLTFNVHTKFQTSDRKQYWNFQKSMKKVILKSKHTFRVRVYLNGIFMELYIYIPTIRLLLSKMQYFSIFSDIKINIKLTFC